MRRLVRDVSSVLIIAGLLMVLDAAVTLVWQEPVTAVIAMVKQSEINRRYLSFETVPLSAVDRRALQSLSNMPERIAFLARREARQVPTGAAIGQLVIKKIGADYVIVQGTDTASLEKGPGHYESTAFPGLGQTVAIAGHRTTYLAPFRNINELVRGDLIQVDMPYADFTYVVQYHRVVPRTHGGSRGTWATNAWCCPPATRSTAPPSGSSCSPRCGARRRPRRLWPALSRRHAGCLAVPAARARSGLKHQRRSARRRRARSVTAKTFRRVR